MHLREEKERLLSHVVTGNVAITCSSFFMLHVVNQLDVDSPLYTM